MGRWRPEAEVLRGGDKSVGSNVSGIHIPSPPASSTLPLPPPPLPGCLVLDTSPFLDMPSIGNAIYYALVVAWGASFYQFMLKDLFATTYGFGRVIQSIDDFPYACRRLEHERLEGCEDLWLDNKARVLYAACAGTESRLAWTPS